MNKSSFVPMTDQAMAVAQGGPAPGGMPPAPAGAPAPGGMPPMGAPMPPPGGMPAPAGGPAPGGAGPSGDPVLDFLLQQGFQVDQQGNWFSPDGQPIPPEVMAQMVAELDAQVAGGAPGGAPAPGGDPAQGGAPPEAVPQGPTPDELIDGVLSALEQMLDEKVGAIESKLAVIIHKLEVIDNLIEDALTNTGKQTGEVIADNVTAEIQQALQGLGAKGATESPAPAVPQAPADLDLLQLLDSSK